MRALGPTLVVLALVFSTGGVAIVGHAGSPEAAKSESSAAPEAGSCDAPVGFRPAPAKQQVLKDAAGNKSIVLNTSGYNYVLDGEWRPSPVGEPQGVPHGVLPADKTAPDAPAKK